MQQKNSNHLKNLPTMSLTRCYSDWRIFNNLCCLVQFYCSEDKFTMLIRIFCSSSTQTHKLTYLCIWNIYIYIYIYMHVSLNLRWFFILTSLVRLFSNLRNQFFCCGCRVFMTVNESHFEKYFTVKLSSGHSLIFRTKVTIKRSLKPNTYIHY